MAYQRIDAGETYQHLSAIADISKPTNESQTRALTGLTPEQKIRVWTEAAKAAVDGKLTAKLVKNTRIRLGLGRIRNPARKPDAPVIDVEAVAVPMAECYGDPESVWTQLRDTLERVRRAWPEGRHNDLHDRLRHYLRLTWPQKYVAAGVAVARVASKVAK